MSNLTTPLHLSTLKLSIFSFIPDESVTLNKHFKMRLEMFAQTKFSIQKELYLLMPL